MKPVSVLLVLCCCIQLPAQDSLLCVGSYWTADEANLVMKKFASTWDDLDSWEQRAKTIKQGILDGHSAFQKTPH